ncbi:hypothetical protein FACS1894181_05860 [Bacteroidia bacterium]|nr:hypothetical protein FACS1894181_05860 [Bacteroidia bacterium]
MIVLTNISSTLHKLRKGEHAGFGEEVVENIKADAESIPTVKEEWDSYELAVYHEGLIYDQTPESPETKKIAVLDKKRNKYWRELLRRLKFDLESPDENISKAADDLLFIMKSFGDVPKHDLFEETVTLGRIFNELKTDESQAAIALLIGFGELVDEAEALNQSLHVLYDKRRIDREKIKELGKLADFRKVVDKLFIAVLESINAAERVNERGAKDPVLAATVERIRLQLNSIIDQLQKNISHHHKKTGGGNNPGPSNPVNPGDGEEGEGDGEEGEGDGEEGNGGDPGEGGDGGTENPDIENPPLPPFLPDFE